MTVWSGWFYSGPTDALKIMHSEFANPHLFLIIIMQLQLRKMGNINNINSHVPLITYIAQQVGVYHIILFTVIHFF